MVNDDFRPDNTIDIELDEEADVRGREEPSLVEIIAYKDTWRQGLDSFLSMLRAARVAEGAPQRRLALSTSTSTGMPCTT